MGFNATIEYWASCDVRVNAEGVAFRPSTAVWEAWRAAARPDVGVEFDALGRTCTARRDGIYAPSAGAARQTLEKDGWSFGTKGRIGGRHFGWRAACPQHHGCLNLPEVDDTAVRATIARQLDQYAPTGDDHGN